MQVSPAAQSELYWQVLPAVAPVPARRSVVVSGGRAGSLQVQVTTSKSLLVLPRVGANRTAIGKLWPAARDMGSGGAELIENALDAFCVVIPAMVIPAHPTFVAVTVAVVAVPSVTVPKSRGLGDRARPPLPAHDPASAT